MRTIEITVKRTLQTAPYESSTVEVKESIEVEDDEADEARTSLYKVITQSVTKYAKNEKLKYTKDE